MNELSAPDLCRYLDPSLDSMLMDCRAAVNLIYMQVRVTKNHQNTMYYRPFVAVKNSTFLPRVGKLIETEVEKR